MGKRKLIVEGKDDEHIVYAVRDKFKIPNSFEVKFLKTPKNQDSGGIELMLKELPIEMKEEGIDVLAIIVDEDTEGVKRWQEIKVLFEKFGYNLPEKPNPDGTIVVHSDNETIYPIKIGIWLMPDNNLQGGKIEDFLKSLIHQNNEQLKIALQSIKNAKEQIAEDKRFKNKDEPKALIHNWLSLQKNPGKPLGQAISANYFDNDSDLIKRFANWLNKVFNE